MSHLVTRTVEIKVRFHKDFFHFSDYDMFEVETIKAKFLFRLGLKPFRVKLDSNLRISRVGESDGIAMLTSVILGALTVVLVLVIIGLVVKVRKLQTGTFSVTMSCCQWKFFYILSICWKTDQMSCFCHIALEENQNPEQRKVNPILVLYSFIYCIAKMKNIQNCIVWAHIHFSLTNHFIFIYVLYIYFPRILAD